MESQNPPSKVARLAHSGIGPTGEGDSEKMKSNGSIGGERSPPIELNLELGRGSNRRHSGTKSFGFTFLQLQELQHQGLIYKYMEVGLPVPYHLVYPLWKSVGSSVGGLRDRPNQHYPSLLGYSPLYLDYRNDIDPEPGRCKRTDGKKWRCSKEAVSEHKYCERHMHRGRQRSRKHVEASQRTTSTPSTNSDSTHMDVLNSNTNLSISLPVSSNSTSGSFSPKSVLHLHGGTLKT